MQWSVVALAPCSTHSCLLLQGAALGEKVVGDFCRDVHIFVVPLEVGELNKLVRRELRGEIIGRALINTQPSGWGESER